MKALYIYMFIKSGFLSSVRNIKVTKIPLVTIHIFYLVCKATAENGSTSFQFAAKLLQSKGRVP